MVNLLFQGSHTYSRIPLILLLLLIAFLHILGSIKPSLIGHSKLRVACGLWRWLNLWNLFLWSRIMISWSIKVVESPVILITSFYYDSGINDRCNYHYWCRISFPSILRFESLCLVLPLLTRCRYAIHLRFICRNRKKFYLYRNIRVVFPYRVPDEVEKLKVIYEAPTDPKFFPCND